MNCYIYGKNLNKSLPTMKTSKLVTTLALCLCFLVLLCKNRPKNEKTQTLTSIHREVDFNFDKDRVGAVPDGWRVEKTGRGTRGEWLVLRDTTSRNIDYVFAQISKRSFGNHFHLAILDNYIVDNVEIEINLKMLDGQEEQSGGVVWRYQNPDNYYACLADPLKERLRLYKVMNGEKRLLKSVWAPKVEAREWEEMDIEHVNDRIECRFDDKTYIELRDSTFTSGKFGLCTKADAVVYFDDLEIEREE